MPANSEAFLVRMLAEDFESRFHALSSHVFTVVSIKT